HRFLSAQEATTEGAENAREWAHRARRETQGPSRVQLASWFGPGPPRQLSRRSRDQAPAWEPGRARPRGAPRRPGPPRGAPGGGPAGAPRALRRRAWPRPWRGAGPRRPAGWSRALRPRRHRPPAPHPAGPPPTGLAEWILLHTIIDKLTPPRVWSP